MEAWKDRTHSITREIVIIIVSNIKNMKYTIYLTWASLVCQLMAYLCDKKEQRSYLNSGTWRLLGCLDSVPLSGVGAAKERAATAEKMKTKERRIRLEVLREAGWELKPTLEATERAKGDGVGTACCDVGE